MKNKHYYAIDLESWVYPDLTEFHNLTPQQRKKLDNGYIVNSTNRLLELLSKYNTKLTFFIIGELYEWYPELIKQIKKCGHEIAYHSHTHRLLTSSKLLQDQLNKSVNFLHDFEPKGFQAPIIYLNKESYSVLKKAGFKYSSSVYNADINSFSVNGIQEIPVSTFRFFGLPTKISVWPSPMIFSRMFKEIPFGSSYFTALIGSRGTSYFINQYEKNNRSAVLFIHNWQIFPPQNATYPNLSFLIKNPLYLPYVKNIKKDFESLIKNYSFDKLENFKAK